MSSLSSILNTGAPVADDSESISDSDESVGSLSEIYMPGYLITHAKETGINPSSDASLLTEYDDEAPAGLPVYHNYKFVCYWPKEDKTLNKALIDVISQELKNFDSPALKNLINQVISPNIDYFLQLSIQALLRLRVKRQKPTTQQCGISLLDDTKH